MKAISRFLLTKIRLSVYFWTFLVGFFVLSYVIPGYKYEAAALTLLTVNSFLYAIQIMPVLTAQKTRIDELHRAIRAEANALFSLVLKLKKLPDNLHHQIQSMITEYIKAKLESQAPTGGEKEYEAIITFCVNHKGEGHDQVDKVLEALVANQQNRTNFSMQSANRVLSNEWHIMFILFSVTLCFVLTLKTEDILILHVIRALISTGLTMLPIILIKLSSLTHKRAKMMWAPLRKLLETNFYRVD